MTQRCLIALLYAVFLSGCVQHIDVVPTHVAGFAPWTEEHRAHVLGAGDELDLHFTLNSELNERTTIGPEGQITAPLIGSVEAAGKTVAELTDTLKQRYAPVLRVPELDVLVVGYGSSRIFVGGEVRLPGALAISGPTDVLQSVILAGGALPTAQLSQVVVLRRRADRTPMLRTVNLKALIGQGAPGEDVELQPFDVVYVPKSDIASFDLFVDQYLNQAVPFQKSLNANIGGSNSLY
jgi:protein involved in polysaccharide export with SLBB domain